MLQDMRALYVPPMRYKRRLLPLSSMIILGVAAAIPLGVAIHEYFWLLQWMGQHITSAMQWLHLAGR